MVKRPAFGNMNAMKPGKLIEKVQDGDDKWAVNLDQGEN
jgi:hypothetical protein